ncbi:uncharacterized protein LOC142337817 [Convolutriloba macropyga]|uniref:uncharacterized protein LOC142337817 n=1 Tax=Convolutriloba macropyga TaxID=536237 RepID=UPI003F520642
MSSGGLNPKRPPPNVSQTKSSRLLARRQQSNSLNSSGSGSLAPRNSLSLQPPVQSVGLSGNPRTSQTNVPTRRLSNYAPTAELANVANASPRVRNRFSLPSIGAQNSPTNPSASNSGVSSLVPPEARRRTNPAQEYFNDVGMILDSDGSPDITEWDFRVTPRNSNGAQSSSRIPVRANGGNGTGNGGNHSGPQSLFPISRTNLLSSRSNTIRPSASSSNLTNSESTNELTDSSERAEVTVPNGSPEFSQVLSQIYASPARNQPPGSDNAGSNSSRVQNADAAEARTSRNTANSGSVQTNETRQTAVGRSQARTGIGSSSNGGGANAGSAVGTSGRSVGANYSPVIAREPLTDTSEFEVESVDDVLTRIRRQNNLPEPTSTQQSSGRTRFERRTFPGNSVNAPETSTNAASNQMASAPRLSVAAENRISAQSSISTPRRSIEETSTSIASRPNFLPSTSTANTSTSVTTTNVTRSHNQPLVASSSSSSSSSNANASNESIRSTVPRRTFTGTRSSPVANNSGINTANGNGEQLNRRSNVSGINRSPTRSDRSGSNSSSSRRSNRRDIRAVLRTPPNERNQIFDEADTPRAVPPIRNQNQGSSNAASSQRTTVHDSEDDDEESDDATPRPRVVVANRNANRIGVRFTSTLDRFANSTRTLRASEDTNTIFSSDDSDEDEETTTTGRTDNRNTSTSGNQTPPETIPHLDTHVGIMQLLGLDLPQSTTEVILLNQRSILEQLLETYITLMVSLQQNNEPQRPAGLSTEVIDKLPRENTTKEQVLENLSCSICLANFEVEETTTKLPECTHLFHHPCITHWLQKSPTCPLCRTPVSDET